MSDKTDDKTDDKTEDKTNKKDEKTDDKTNEKTEDKVNEKTNEKTNKKANVAYIFFGVTVYTENIPENRHVSSQDWKDYDEIHVFKYDGNFLTVIDNIHTTIMEKVKEKFVKECPWLKNKEIKLWPRYFSFAIPPQPNKNSCIVVSTYIVIDNKEHLINFMTICHTKIKIDDNILSLPGIVRIEYPGLVHAINQTTREDVAKKCTNTESAIIINSVSASFIP